MSNSPTSSKKEAGGLNWCGILWESIFAPKEAIGQNKNPNTYV